MGIASFGEEDAEAVLSGIPLLRKCGTRRAAPSAVRAPLSPRPKVHDDGVRRGQGCRLPPSIRARCAKEQQRLRRRPGLDLIPDHMIALWHPESRSENEKKVGKQTHLETLMKATSGAVTAMKQIVLFDDDANNIKIAKKNGVRAWYCDATNAKQTELPSGFNREIWSQFVAKKGGASGGGGCTVM